MPGTIRDVAKAAGVSATTVSHVINRTRYVNPEVAEKVKKAIAETGYSISKKSLNRAGLFALLLPHIDLPYYSKIAETLSRQLKKKEKVCLYFL